MAMRSCRRVARRRGTRTIADESSSRVGGPAQTPVAMSSSRTGQISWPTRPVHQGALALLELTDDTDHGARPMRPGGAPGVDALLEIEPFERGELSAQRGQRRDRSGRWTVGHGGGVGRRSVRLLVDLQALRMLVESRPSAGDARFGSISGSGSGVSTIVPRRRCRGRIDLEGDVSEDVDQRVGRLGGESRRRAGLSALGGDVVAAHHAGTLSSAWAGTRRRAMTCRDDVVVGHRSTQVIGRGHDVGIELWTCVGDRIERIDQRRSEQHRIARRRHPRRRNRRRRRLTNLSWPTATRRHRRRRPTHHPTVDASSMTDISSSIAAAPTMMLVRRRRRDPLNAHRPTTRAASSGTPRSTGRRRRGECRAMLEPPCPFPLR